MRISALYSCPCSWARCVGGTGAASAPVAPVLSLLIRKVEQARPIEEALKTQPVGKRRGKVDAPGSSDSNSSAAESDSEQEQQQDYLSSQSSDLSVDTDADSGVEATPDAVLKRVISVHIDKDCDSKKQRLVGSAAEAPASSASGVARHAPGTWKVWEGTWFYATKTPGFSDVKVIMKGPFRNVSEGMGNTNMSKAAFSAALPRRLGGACQNHVVAAMLACVEGAIAWVGEGQGVSAARS